MKINIVASHSFQLSDLARELEQQGHDVRFYFYALTARSVKFGLKTECSRSLVLLILTFLSEMKIARRSFRSAQESLDA